MCLRITSIAQGNQKLVGVGVGGDGGICTPLIIWQLRLSKFCRKSHGRGTRMPEPRDSILDLIVVALGMWNQASERMATRTIKTQFLYWFQGPIPRSGSHVHVFVAEIVRTKGQEYLTTAGVAWVLPSRYLQWQYTTVFCRMFLRLHIVRKLPCCLDYRKWRSWKIKSRNTKILIPTCWTGLSTTYSIWFSAGKGIKSVTRCHWWDGAQ